MRQPILTVALGLLSLAIATVSAAQSAPGDSADPAPRMKPSPFLEPPPPRPSKPPQPAAASEERDVIFLRADRLGGEAQQWIEAEGNVEMRSRRQTVVADW